VASELFLRPIAAPLVCLASDTVLTAKWAPEVAAVVAVFAARVAPLLTVFAARVAPVLTVFAARVAPDVTVVVAAVFAVLARPTVVFLPQFAVVWKLVSNNPVRPKQDTRFLIRDLGSYPTRSVVFRTVLLVPLIVLEMTSIFACSYLRILWW